MVYFISYLPSLCSDGDPVTSFWKIVLEPFKRINIFDLFFSTYFFLKDVSGRDCQSVTQINFMRIIHALCVFYRL